MENKTKNKFRLSIFIIAVALIGIGFTGGFIIGQSKIPSVEKINSVQNKELGKSTEVDFSIFWDTWKIIEDKYVDKDNLNPQEMVFGAAQGLVKSLNDPYSVFLFPKESKKFKDEVNGSFEGVGMEIGIRNNMLVVIAPLEGTPAQKAGLKAGDKILKIDETLTQDLSLEQAVDLIRGPKGTEVVLTITRDSLNEAKEITIVRNTIEIPVVKWEIKNGNIAYIQLFQFSANATPNFNRITDEILKSQADSIVLDLRNNPGGFLETSVEIAGWFFEQDSLVAIEKFGDGKEIRYNTSHKNGIFKDWPLVVLVNEGSASASEILAGALRDNRNIKLIGEKTFGKGSVQQLADLKKEGASLKITVAKWLTPKGLSINDNGLEADIEVKNMDDSEEDIQLQKALEIIQSI